MPEWMQTWGQILLAVFLTAFSIFIIGAIAWGCYELARAVREERKKKWKN